jgi:hypothetical protein
MMVMQPDGYTNQSFAWFGVPVLLGALLTACVMGNLLVRR